MIVIIVVVWHLWARLVRSSSFAYFGFLCHFYLFLVGRVSPPFIGGFLLSCLCFLTVFSSFLSLHVVSLGCFCVPFCGLSP